MPNARRVALLMYPPSEPWLSMPPLNKVEALCKHTGWIEVLGGGVVNRKVLENCNIDPDEYAGFAFGIGIERIAMLKYGINNIGLMFENNLQFLKQFHE